MKREACLKKAQERMVELSIQRDIITTIPINTPVLMHYRCPIRSKGWKWEVIRLVCEIFDFNKQSIRATMIAVENAEAYPFDHDIERRNQNKLVNNNQALGLTKIEKWEPFKDLPLLIGWPNQYIRLAELLKSGPPKRSLDELGASIPKASKEPWTVVGFDSTK